MSLVVTSGPIGGVKPRLNIVDFVKHEKFFTLYIRALQHMQEKPQTVDWQSFFQLAAIHGLPFKQWARKNPSEDPTLAGYCAHGQVLFPVWHRAYTAVYEQTIQEIALKLAEKFTCHTHRWREAAHDLRQPFWDWADKMVPPDEVIKMNDVEIIDYDGCKRSTWNPLLRYHFHPVDESFKAMPGQVADWGTTRRHPDLKGNTDVHGLIERFNKEQASTRHKVLSMLNNVSNWEDFSNHGDNGDEEVPESDPHVNSLEAIHDNVHGFVGEGQEIPGTAHSVMLGHMTIPEIASFDPIFFLHHAGIDRLLSFWYAIHDVWVSEGKESEPTMGIPAGKVDKNTPLEPFYQTEDVPWTSVPLVDTTRLGYSYPEFHDLVGASKELIRDVISERVNKLYGTDPSSKHAPNSALDLLSNFHGITRDHTKDLQMYDWTIRVSFKKFELKNSFSLRFYFANDEGGSDEENYLGSVTSFHRSLIDGCANCKSHRDLVQLGYIHLNHHLAHNIRSFSPADVRKHLNQKKLTYKLESGGEGTLKTLNITIRGRPLIIPARRIYSKVDKDLPHIVYDDLVVHPRI